MFASTTSLNAPLLAPVSPCLLIFNGFPGVGKLTNSRHLLAALTATNPTILLHKHLLIDPATAIHPLRTPAHHTRRASLRALAFSALTLLPDANTVVIITTCCASNPADAAIIGEQVVVARVWGIRAEMAALRRRVGSEERKAGWWGKLTDASVLKELVAGCVLLKPGDYERVVKGVQVRELEIKTTDLAVEKAAGRVLRVFGELPVERKGVEVC